MKALLKSGDTEKVIFFAGVSRQREIYIMAANYLQSLDWHKNPEIMRNIIGLYSKGRALDLLANFYVACSQMEIDEFQNYRKALGAVTEARQCLLKLNEQTQTVPEAKMEELNRKIKLIGQFIDIKNKFIDGKQEAVNECSEFLKELDLDKAVYPGDVYSLLIEHFAKVKQWKQANHYLEQLQQLVPIQSLPRYIDLRLVNTIREALQLPALDPLPPDTGTEDTADAVEDTTPMKPDL